MASIEKRPDGRYRARWPEYPGTSNVPAVLLSLRTTPTACHERRNPASGRQAPGILVVYTTKIPGACSWMASRATSPGLQVDLDGGRVLFRDYAERRLTVTNTSGSLECPDLPV